MNENNLGNILNQGMLLPMQSVTATGNGTGVDMQDYVGQVAVVLASKNTAGTNPTLDVKLQDSADNSTFADITGATFTQVTNANTSAAVSEKITININGAARYVRAVATIGGTSSPAFMTACTFVGGKQNRS